MNERPRTMTSTQGAELRYAPAAVPSAGPRALILFLAALAMTWPAWINGGPLLFFDSPGYLTQGRTAVEGTLAALRPPPPGGAPDTAAPAGAPDTAAPGGPSDTVAPGGPSDTVAPDGAPATSPEAVLPGDAPGGFEAVAATAEFIRSLGYSGFSYIASLSPLGVFGVILAQALVVAGMLAVLGGRDLLVRPRDGLVLAGLCLMLTPLPWFVSYLMPDILAAVPILIGMILVRDGDRLGFLAVLFLLGAATFAALSHYGHLPLALGIGVAALVVLALQRRVTLAAVLLALAPTGLAVGINAAGSAVAFEAASPVPKRLPILLARSIADGPAFWHLQENCATENYAICEVYDGEVPNNLQRLLWTPSGLINRATPDQIERIRDEEMTILLRAFSEHPFRQTWSLAGNAVRQLVLIGTDDFQWGNLTTDDGGELRRENAGRTGLSAVAALHIASSLAALLLIVYYAGRDGLGAGRREREMALLLLLGLLANAAVFGGLSAPVDRYGARIAWLLPVLAGLLWLARRPGAAAEPPGGPPS